MQKNKSLAMLAYFLFFIPLLTDQKNDPFVKYHTKQGFVLFVTACICWFVGQILFFYWIFPLLSLGIFVLFIIGLINASNEKETPLPLIGQFADKVNFL
jgi:uncharacterized membrane protein